MPAEKPRVKSADWTEDETHVVLETWAPKFSKLRGASQREKSKIWNDIYSLYNESCPDSQRTLQQVKKRQQNLDNEYKQLEQQTRSTGEAGIKKIKEGFPYFDIFDEVMGHRNSIDPSKMAIEGSSTFTSEPSVNDASQNESESEPPDDVTEVQESSVKRKAGKNKQENSGRKGKRRRRDVPESTTQDWQSSFVEMWERVWNRTMQDLNYRRKCSVKPRAGKWNKQTPYLLASKTFLTLSRPRGSPLTSKIVWR